jgi:hypothetical protein
MPSDSRTILGRTIFGFMGLFPICIGLVFLCIIWVLPLSDFGPLGTLFKVFASLVAFGFLGVGSILALVALFARPATPNAPPLAQEYKPPTIDEEPPTPAVPVSPNYTCPQCGAVLSRAEVSPLGDVKCNFCGSWFNIYNPAGKMPG